MLHRGIYTLSSNHDDTQVIKISVVHLHSGVVLVSKLISGLHMPRVKEIPSLGFLAHRKI
jgi:hypothetical protein